MKNKNLLIVGGVLLLAVVLVLLGLILPQYTSMPDDAINADDENSELEIITPTQEVLTATPLTVTDTPAAGTAAEAATAEPTASANTDAAAVNARTGAEAPDATGTDLDATATDLNATGTDLDATSTDLDATATDLESKAEEPIAYVLVTVSNLMYTPIPLTQEGDFAVRQAALGTENIVHVTLDSIQMTSSTCDNQDCVEQGIVTLENRSERVLGNAIVCLPNGVMVEILTPEEAEELMASVASAE